MSACQSSFNNNWQPANVRVWRQDYRFWVTASFVFIFWLCNSSPYIVYWVTLHELLFLVQSSDCYCTFCIWRKTLYKFVHKFVWNLVQCVILAYRSRRTREVESIWETLILQLRKPAWRWISQHKARMHNTKRVYGRIYVLLQNSDWIWFLQALDISSQKADEDNVKVEQNTVNDLAKETDLKG